MEFIAHRINRLDDLFKVPKDYGVEVDLRDYDGNIVLQHDPFKDGDNFEKFLSSYKHGTLILNIKSEQIEYKVLELIHKYKIKKYFLLDSSFPMIYKLSNNGEKNLAIRLSDFEGIETIINMKGKVKWVWLDCFDKFILNKNIYNVLKKNNFKICIVSPALHHRSNEIRVYTDIIKGEKFVLDAVCDKLYNSNKWMI
ncbi:MAG: hypothetical protein CMG74_10475 [Candidatus Marinimicrobia bacterium]|nr:hypothetical protein [Candidatus Neomarinimicrobiota bacterium]|tara:strand:- start:20675 stop:21265 length:591 start_codon:yes stop_codon:yes gene_type:complete